MSGRGALRRWSLATLLPWLVAGVAAACALGELTVTSADRPHRLGLPPPPWVFGLAVAAAVLAAVILRRTRAPSAPLLLGAVTLVPWLPIPLPAVALAFTGPLRWSLWAAAGVLLAASAISGSRRIPASWLTSPRRAPVTAALLALLVFAGARALIGNRIPTGDEPHYLLLAQSIVADRDLDVENNYTRRDYAPYYPGELEPHWYVRGLGGKGILYHLPGLPALVAPALLTGGAMTASLWLALLCAAGTALVWRLGYEVGGREAGSAWFGWATATLTLPMAAQSAMIYPDAPGAIVTAGLMLGLASDERARRTRGPGIENADTWSLPVTALVGIGCGALPWLHTRLALPAVFGVLCLVLRMRTWRRKWAHALTLLGLLLTGIGSWLWYFRFFYGVWDPRAPYASQTPFDPFAAMAGAIAMFADQSAGLLPNAPVYALAFYAFWLLARTRPRLAAEYAVIAVPYLALNAGFHMWWGGTSVPGRLMLAVLLPFAATTALAWRHCTGAARLAALCLLALSAMTAGSRVLGGGGRLLFPDSAGRNLWLDWLSPIVDLTPGLPGYFSAPRTLAWDAVIWAVAIAACLGLTKWLSARIRLRAAAQATAYVAAAFLGAMGAVEVLWARSHAAVIAPTASQLSILAHVRDRGSRRVLDVGRAAWVDADVALARLDIGSDRLPPRGEALSLQVAGIAPGRYLLQDVPRVRPGQRLSLWIGRSGDPIDEWPREETGMPRLWELTLPAGARAVSVRADPSGPAPPRVTLRPMAVLPSPANVVDADEVAIRGARYGALRVFAFEDDVWLEPQGVWVGGGRAGRLVVSAPEGRLRVTVTARAGPPGARVMIDGPGLALERVLGPLESLTLDLPIDAPSRASWITVRTDRGFRPADYEPASRDRRFLGCSLTFQ